MTLTRDLVSEVARLANQQLDEHVASAARRTLLNALGTSIGASKNGFVDAVVRTGIHEGGAPIALVPGRAERLDAHWAAIATGLAAHIDDFDDTHLETMIHPGAAVLGAALTVGVVRKSNGAQFLTAFALGCEVQLRLGKAMTPWHYDQGWHITGTCGVMGAATTAGLLVGLDSDELSTALGLAASQTLGIREAFGSSVKAFHPGKAAANGILAASLAARGFTASDRILEADRGYFNVLSPEHAPDRVLDGFGAEWELTQNTFKPYPCGIVSHPAIDAALAAGRHISDPSIISRVTINCHPLVLELTNNSDPATGLEARFSTSHGAAVGLLDGTVGLAQYETARVRAPDAIALRAKVRLHATPRMPRDAASIEIRLEDGSSVHEKVEHATGSLARPLDDLQLQQKIRTLVEPVLAGRTEPLVEAVSLLQEASNLSLLESLITPEGNGARQP